MTNFFDIAEMTNSKHCLEQIFFQNVGQKVESSEIQKLKKCF